MPLPPADRAIHIALCFDDNFWAPAYAVMRSACLSSPRRKDLVFHLCEMAVTPEHKRDLDGIADEFGATVHYYDLAQNSEFKRICGPLPSTRP